MARHDVRTTAGLDDASRSDLARETKQTLAYAEIAAALSVRRERGSNPPSTSPPLLAAQRGLEVLARAMRSAVDALVAPAGFSYAGLDESSFEPVFEALGRRVSFDGLPTRVRHLVAFAALPVRALWSAYPGRDPRLSEGVVLIDEVDLQQDPGVQASLVGALRTALPRVQWILTTTSPAVAGSCDTLEVLALRRSSEVDRIELFVGSEARTH
jgi:hypothetical protein